MAEEKHMMYITAMVAIVAVAGLMINTSSNMAGAAYREPMPEQLVEPIRANNNAFINAHSCNADGVCEVQTLSVNDIHFENSPEGQITGTTKYLCVDDNNNVFVRFSSCHGLDRILVLSYGDEFTATGQSSYNLSIDGVEFTISFIGGNADMDAPEGPTNAILRVIRDGSQDTRSFVINQTRELEGIHLTLNDIHFVNIGAIQVYAFFEIVTIE